MGIGSGWKTAGAAAALSLNLGCAGAAPAQDGVALPDGRRIHLVCSGAGSPTVLLESGFGADAGAWYAVQPLVAKTRRVCSYDRAGYGASTPGPLPREGEAIAADLDAALRAAKIEGPFIGVGHSAGGLYIRLFAARRPADVVGLVLVDPSVEHQTARIDRVFGPGAGSVDGIRTHSADCLAAVETPGTSDAREACLPGRNQPAARAAAMKPQYWRSQISELDTLFAATSDQVVASRSLARAIPAVVLTAASVEGPTQDLGEQLHRRLHAELAGEFADGRQRLVKSSHMMIFDRPEVIAAEIESMAARSGRPGAGGPATPPAR